VAIERITELSEKELIERINVHCRDSQDIGNGQEHQESLLRAILYSNILVYKHSKEK
jgi:hypothetical protein